MNGLAKGIKKALRDSYLRARDSISPKERKLRSDKAVSELCKKDSFANSKIILAYHPIGSEFDTQMLIEAALVSGKTVALPVTKARRKELAWHRIQTLDDLLPGHAGILEPKDDPSTLLDISTFDESNTIAIVPGVVFDRNGYRIGYGGGYYDRFLDRFEGRTIGVAFEEQVVDDLCDIGAIEPHDVPLYGLLIA